VLKEKHENLLLFHRFTSMASTKSQRRHCTRLTARTTWVCRYQNVTPLGVLLRQQMTKVAVVTTGTLENVQMCKLQSGGALAMRRRL